MEGTASPEMNSGLRAVIHPNTESPEMQYPAGTEHFPINTPSESGSPATTVQPKSLESDSKEQGQLEGLDESYKRRGQNTPPPRDICISKKIGYVWLCFRFERKDMCQIYPCLY